MQDNLIPVEYVNLNGARVDTTPQPRKKPKTDPQPYHKGWVVVGRPKGSCEAARIAHEAAQLRYLGMAPSDRKALNARDPGLWDELRWRQRAKKVRIRTEPFGIEASADEMAVLAKRQGWEDVEVKALSRGE